MVMDTQSSAEIELAEFMQTYRTVFFIDSMMGAGVIAWNFFYPGEPVPVMLRALEDIHLGRYAFRDAREFEDGVEVVLDYWLRHGPLGEQPCGSSRNQSSHRGRDTRKAMCTNNVRASGKAHESARPTCFP